METYTTYELESKLGNLGTCIIKLLREKELKPDKDYEDGSIGWFCGDIGIFHILYEDEHRNFSFNNVRWVHEVQHLMRIVDIDKQIIL